MNAFGKFAENQQNYRAPKFIFKIPLKYKGKRDYFTQSSNNTIFLIEHIFSGPLSVCLSLLLSYFLCILSWYTLLLCYYLTMYIIYIYIYLVNNNKSKKHFHLISVFQIKILIFWSIQIYKIVIENQEISLFSW